jgi:hypothetical protein
MKQATDKRENIEFDNLNFLRVRPESSFSADRIDDYDAVIIEYSDHHDVLQTINKIRSHNEKSIYITPVFLLNEAGNMDDSIVALTDGVIVNLTNLDSAAAVTRKIKSRM